VWGAIGEEGGGGVDRPSIVTVAPIERPSLYREPGDRPLSSTFLVVRPLPDKPLSSVYSRTAAFSEPRMLPTEDYTPSYARPWPAPTTPPPDLSAPLSESQRNHPRRLPPLGSPGTLGVWADGDDEADDKEEDQRSVGEGKSQKLARRAVRKKRRHQLAVPASRSPPPPPSTPPPPPRTDFY
jgi:hypothetical protein